ncbi:MAG: hypothetical protein ACRDRV_19655 [Pseudonocardiaceae bacterium]
MGGLSSLGAHTGSRDAFLFMADAGFSSVGKVVHLQPVPNHPSHCILDGFVDPGTGFRSLNVEVIDPVTFNYIALNTVTLSDSAPYTEVGVGWDAGPGSQADPLIRFSLLGNPGGPKASVRVDDVKVICNY